MLLEYTEKIMLKKAKLPKAKNLKWIDTQQFILLDPVFAFLEGRLSGLEAEVLSSQPLMDKSQHLVRDILLCCCGICKTQ